MKPYLTDDIVRALPAPSKGNKITYDGEVKGFGVRVTTANARAFILNYRTKLGIERRYTIGSFPDWPVNEARDRAKELKRQIDLGGDPMLELHALRMSSPYIKPRSGGTEPPEGYFD